MRNLKNGHLRELLVQLRFTPEAQRQKQVESVEELIGIIEKDKEYPFEFVCFKITGYHPKGKSGSELIKGQALIDDLRFFISELSGQLGNYAEEQDEKVYVISELAKELGVSRKTIHRWRKRGLVARKFIFEDGKKRLAFLQSSVDKFLGTHPDLVKKGGDFTKLSKKERGYIIKRAGELGSKAGMSRYQAIELISEESGRSHEAVRYTILNAENRRSGKGLFKKPAGVIQPGQGREIYKLFNQGMSLPELMKQFDRSKSSIYRIIKRRRARALMSKRIEFIANDEFLEDGAKDKILSKGFCLEEFDEREVPDVSNFKGGSLSKYMKALNQAPLFRREQERELFRRYNYVKFLADNGIRQLKPHLATSAEIKEIEDYLAEAERIKNIIIEANLRLVVNIANKHTISGANLLDLISEGNFAMMHAVEKFDYARGFRFSTYASWAIVKDFARKIPAEKSRPDKAGSASVSEFQDDLRKKAAGGAAEVERARTNLVQAIKDNLDEREQYVIINHFGLTGTLVKKNKKTLKQIGEDLELTKERVRQVELVALQKLRQYLSIEEFELLTG